MDPRARITERGRGRDDASDACDVGDSDDVGDGIDAGDGGGQKGMQGGCQVGDSGTPEPPWSLSHPPKLIIIAVCDINIRFNNIRFNNLSNTDTFLVFANVL